LVTELVSREISHNYDGSEVLDRRAMMCPKKREPAQ